MTPRGSLRPVTLLLALLSVCRGSLAQTDNPVYVDDSPQAWLLFLQAQDQASGIAHISMALS